MEFRRYQERLAQLVAAPSVSCSEPALDMGNLGVINLLANWLDELGFHCRIEAVNKAGEKFNLIAVKGQGDNGLVLAGHTDTVPYNAERWQQDPFSLTLRDEKLYGLGATDMKGFFPVVLAALERVAELPLGEPVIVLATADEESSMSGARALVEQKFPNARYAIIGEPTGMQPVHMHKGIMMEAIRVTGKAGHSSNPALGLNALEVMNEVMTELLRYRADLQQNYQNHSFDVNVPTLNLGCIHGGDNPNRICSACELHFDLRMLPGMELESLRAGIQTRISPIAEKYQTDVVLSSLFEGVPAFEQSANSDLVELVGALTQKDPQPVAFATEAPFLQALDIQTVVMGPGSIDQAHQANEFIALDQISPSIDIIERLIRKVCIA